ncbi:Mate efflux family protein (Partial), partial [Seminavis robusta]
GYYARVLSFAIPAIVAFRQFSNFFSAQRIMHPERNSAMVGLSLNLILGLVFVLGWPIPGFEGYQFTACPIVTVAVTYIQLATLVIVYLWRQKLHEPCWGGWDWNEITWARINTYCELYFPAAMSLASDFWRVAVIGAIAARLGEEQVAVFNTSYRIMWIALIMVGAMSNASAINMSIRLGKNQPEGARQAGYVGIAMATAILTVLSTLILCHSDWFGRIFTEDPVFLQMFNEASVPFTFTLFFMNLGVAIERIPYSMGRTRDLFWTGFLASWGGQVPGVILCTQYWRSDLFGLYTGMAIGYGMLVILYSVITLKSDWVQYAEIARRRSEVAMT